MMLLFLLTAVCTSCRLQHTKACKKNDFDDGEGAEKVSGFPNSQCKCCFSIAMSCQYVSSARRRFLFETSDIDTWVCGKSLPKIIYRFRPA